MADILVTGSLAYDFIMQIGGRFADRLEAKPAAGFSAAYTAPAMRRMFGGCAGNVAYGLRQLGGDWSLMGTVGEDFDPYRKYLKKNGGGELHLLKIKGKLTAQAYLIGDSEGSQMIFFHPGASAEAHRQSVADLPSPPDIAIVGPNGREGMLRFCRELSAAGIPFMFDPGQAVGLFSAEELEEMISLCQIAAFNRDEHEFCLRKTQARPSGASGAVIITHGAGGSEIWADGRTYRTGAVDFGRAADITGCGDAYRAAVLHAWFRGWEWMHIIRFASVVAGAKAVCMGGQGYTISAAEAETYCRRNFTK